MNSLRTFIQSYVPSGTKYHDTVYYVSFIFIISNLLHVTFFI